MLKGAIYFFAFSFLLAGCAIQSTPPSHPVASQPPSHPGSAVIEASPGNRELESARTEIEMDIHKEEEVVSEPETPKESLLFPDIAITDLFLNPKRQLVVTLANIGDTPLSMGGGTLRIFVDEQLKRSYALGPLSGRGFLEPKESVPFTTTLRITGSHEVWAYVDPDRDVRELRKENNSLKKRLEGVPVGPDIMVKDLALTEDLELSIILANGGEVDLRKGVTLRIRIFVDGKKISDFEHFTFEALKANSANHYIIDPPYRVELSGTSRVRISVSLKLPSHDTLSGNNSIERTFAIFPFKIEPQGREKFSFTVSSSNLKGGRRGEKIKAEARWDGGGSPLVLSFTGGGQSKNVPIISGKSPLKVEFPALFAAVKRESIWNVSVTNLMEKRAEGHLIIQHQ